MAAQHERGYQNHRYYNSNGSYRIVYTAGSAAPRYDEQPSAPARKPQRQSSSAPARKPQRQSSSVPARKPQRQSSSVPARKPRQGSGQRKKKDGKKSAETRFSYKTAASAGRTKTRRPEERQASYAKRRTAQAASAAPRTISSGEPALRQPAAVPLTKKEQAARTRRAHIARNNQKRESYMNRSLATFLIGMAAVVCGCCGIYVHMTAEVQATESRISSLNAQIEDLQAQNNAYESAVYSGLDLETIRTEAEQLGMGSVEEAKIRYFVLEDEYYTDTVTLTE